MTKIAQFTDKIRPSDSKINALARLIDTAIICMTLIALVSLLRLEWLPVYGWLLLISVSLFSFFSESSYTYRSWRGISLPREISGILINWTVIVLVILSVNAFFNPSELYNRELIVYWFIFTPIELISWHSILRMMVARFRSSQSLPKKAVVLGATDLGVALRDELEDMEWSGYEFRGYYDDRALKDDKRAKVPEGSTLLGGFKDLVRDARAGKIHTVFVALPLGAEKRIKELFKELSDSTVSVYLMLDIFSFDLLNARWMDIHGMPAVSIYENPHRGIDNFTKRVFDLVVGSLILMLILVPMAFIALGVKLTSRGPVLFKQKRYGIHGDEISVWKFRSMSVMDAGDGEVKQATKGDVRITPFGGFLRKTSLDELPQFFNVLAGTMSIVGPRPHAVSHNEHYRSAIHGYMLRHKVKPGITGLAQISGFRGETETLDKMEGRIKYDLDYIRNWSVLLDVKIILSTVFKGFLNKNAY